MTRCELADRGIRAIPMIPRTRFLITAALLCHLLIAHPLVTSQLLSGPPSPTSQQNSASIPGSLQSEDVNWSAISQEEQGKHVKLRGKVEIHYGLYVLHADEVTYNTDTRE